MGCQVVPALGEKPQFLSSRLLEGPHHMAEHPRASDLGDQAGSCHVLDDLASEVTPCLGRVSSDSVGGDCRTA